MRTKNTRGALLVFAQIGRGERATSSRHTAVSHPHPLRREQPGSFARIQSMRAEKEVWAIVTVSPRTCSPITSTRGSGSYAMLGCGPRVAAGEKYSRCRATDAPRGRDARRDGPRPQCHRAPSLRPGPGNDPLWTAQPTLSAIRATSSFFLCPPTSSLMMCERTASRSPCVLLAASTRRSRPASMLAPRRSTRPSV